MRCWARLPPTRDSRCSGSPQRESLAAVAEARRQLLGAAEYSFDPIDAQQRGVVSACHRTALPGNSLQRDVLSCDERLEVKLANRSCGAGRNQLAAYLLPWTVDRRRTQAHRHQSSRATHHRACARSERWAELSTVLCLWSADYAPGSNRGRRRNARRRGSPVRIRYDASRRGFVLASQAHWFHTY